MLLSNLQPCFFFTCVFALIGALIALVALLAPIRRLAQSNWIARTITLTVLGLLSLAVGFGIWPKFIADVDYVFSTAVTWDTFEPRTGGVRWPYEGKRPAIVNELWIRKLVPPPMRQTCYSDDAEVCSVVDDISARYKTNWGWIGYLRDFSISSVSVLACTALVWGFTRRRSLPPAG